MNRTALILPPMGPTNPVSVGAALPLVSVLINNYNYGRFLREAIDSALGQSYPHLEVIVVDDGSTDDSSAVIASYGERIVPVLKANGGQASTFNAGFMVSQGEVICLLDADDVFEPDKVARVVNRLQAIGGTKQEVLLFHDLRAIDENGAPSEQLWRTRAVNGENYYRHAQKYRSLPWVVALPSGVALTKRLMQRVLPLPEGFPIGADSWLVRGAMLLGRVYKVDGISARYRIHGANQWYGKRKFSWQDQAASGERFLNDLLVENGLSPVVDFSRSWDFRGYYQEMCCPGSLLALAFQVPAHHLDMATARFFPKTVALALTTALKCHLGRRLHTSGAKERSCSSVC